jgi:hypothetical protein
MEIEAPVALRYDGDSQVLYVLTTTDETTPKAK